MPFTVTTGYWRREMDPTEGWVWCEITDDFPSRADAEAFIARQREFDKQVAKRLHFTRSKAGEYTISERAIA